MKLAIADPPYLGRAQRHYGIGASNGHWHSTQTRQDTRSPLRTTEHHAAAEWDTESRHEQLVRDLQHDYQGWAIALLPSNLPAYLRWVPKDTRICTWVKPNGVPGGARVVNRWEPVLVYIPEPRRRAEAGRNTPDYLVASVEHVGHTGAKPAKWTRWVLDMLGYHPEVDTIDDLFAGSHQVERWANQQPMW